MRVSLSLVLVAQIAVMCGSFAAGCGSELPAGTEGDSGAVGRLQIPLVTSADDGRTYVLRNAIFDCSGPAAPSLVAPDDGSDVSVEVPLGLYAVTLRDGWQLERREDDGTLTPVTAVLASANPLTARVLPQSTEVVPFRFFLGDDTGRLEVSFGVSAHAVMLAGSFDVYYDAYLDGAGNPTSQVFTDTFNSTIDYVLRFQPDRVDRYTLADGTKITAYSGGPSYVSLRPGRASPMLSGINDELRGKISFLSLLLAPDGTLRLRASVDAYLPPSWGWSGYDGFRIQSGELDDATLDADGFAILPPPPYASFTSADDVRVQEDMLDEVNHRVPYAWSYGPGVVSLQIP
jgi:hypothetical protein